MRIPPEVRRDARPLAAVAEREGMLQSRAGAAVAPTIWLIDLAISSFVIYRLVSAESE